MHIYQAGWRYERCQKVWAHRSPILQSHSYSTSMRILLQQPLLHISSGGLQSAIFVSVKINVFCVTVIMWMLMLHALILWANLPTIKLQVLILLLYIANILHDSMVLKLMASISILVYIHTTLIIKDNCRHFAI